MDDAERVTNAGQVSGEVRLPVFGHPVHFRTNSPAVRAVIEEWYGYWRGLRPDLVTGATFTVAVTVDSGDEGGRPPIFDYHLPTVNELHIETHGSRGLVDVDRCAASADITTELLEFPDLFRTGLLDTMVLMLVTSVDRCPVHAAAVFHAGRLVLLVGPSGSGKSTLAYALQEAGFEVRSDDAVYVQLRPAPRIWFHRKGIGLLPSAARQFSGLRGAATRVQATGKVKVMIPPVHRPSPEPSEVTPIVCMLERGHHASMTRIQDGRLRALLDGKNEAGFDRLATQRVPVLDWLAHCGGWKLTLSSRAGDAVPFIQELVTT
jgi:hypothetical protein